MNYAQNVYPCRIPFWYGNLLYAPYIQVFLQGHSTTNKKIAEQNHCYKMMLLTGSKEESTLNFYRNAGYNSSDKTAFIQWIN